MWKDNIKKWTGQSLSSLLTTEVDEQPSQQGRLLEYPNDARGSRELVISYIAPGMLRRLRRQLRHLRTRRRQASTRETAQCIVCLMTQEEEEKQNSFTIT